ncbi:hypothetical protein SAMD00019534_002740, partial [Acytostelium subglobosum LB1]|uniref:hypothetical protein n=1 Tax=Acytostelium subglobosum LB1 TaxID=1410327 RepID=UPI000644955D
LNSKQSKEPKPFKIVLIGDSVTGKTCIVERAVKNRFTKNTSVTLGHSVVIASGNKVMLDLWDTTGQERFNSMMPMFYRGASAAILVYDVTNRMSLFRLQRWAKEVQDTTKKALVLAIVGNKIDLPDRGVCEEEVNCVAAEIGANAIIMETSALTGQNINELFIAVATRLSETQGVVN